MSYGSTTKQARAAGFSLVELLIVVAIIVIMAAVALPNIGGYIRNYRIRGAAQEVAGEIQSARTKAIMTNTNAGVSFAIVDNNSYRFLREDSLVSTTERYGPLRDLPVSVQFVPATANPGNSFRYGRLGSWCKPATTGCAAPVTPLCQTTPLPDETPRCGAPGNYMTVDATAGVTITLLETATGLQRQIVVSPGGRVRPVQ